ncbi:MAG: hypothetical protein DBX61_04550 [Clostridiales bacterium]|nr:MAG: hypothetical protein DBX61_04550 [Clostridiales bacterium]
MFAHINPHHEIGARSSNGRMQTSLFLPIPGWNIAGKEPEKTDAGSTEPRTGHHPCESRVFNGTTRLPGSIQFKPKYRASFY